MNINDSYNFCWLCSDEVEDMDEVEVTPDVTIWLCTKHARMRNRAEAKEEARLNAREVSAWWDWHRRSA